MRLELSIFYILMHFYYIDYISKVNNINIYMENVVKKAVKEYMEEYMANQDKLDVNWRSAQGGSNQSQSGSNTQEVAITILPNQNP